MAVFLSASDETGASSAGMFSHCGLVASVDEWVNAFTPQWERRVIEGPPRIDYFHMTDLRNPNWREEHGLTETDAEARIDAAVDVVCGIKRIYLIAVSVDAAMFKEELGDAYKRLAAQYKEIRTAHMKALLEQPDYQVLLGYMIYALYWLHGREPEARKLDFVIERKKKLSHWFKQSHDDLPGALVEWGKPELVRLVGVLEDVKKEDQRRPVEAADLLSWYRQRADANLIQDGTPDLERVRRLFELPGNGFTVPREQMAGLFASMVLRSGDDAIT